MPAVLGNRLFPVLAFWERNRIFCLALIVALALVLLALSQKDLPFAGRWDLTITAPDGTYPSWLEATGDKDKPGVRVVGRAGSVHPVNDLKLVGLQMSFSTPEEYKGQTTFTWNLRVKGRRISGTQTRGDGNVGQIAGVPAPPLYRPYDGAWTGPEPIFDGSDLNGWEPDNPSANHWKAENGELINAEPGSNLHTTRKFQDFKLHIEYNCPKDGNSGVYLRGRYEVQVEYEAAGSNDQFHGIGSIYGFLAPEAAVKPRPGEWESYDVTLVGRNVTVVRDKVLIVDHKDIPGITGGAMDSHEAEPGPFCIQGNYTGALRFRNITVSVPKS